MEKIKRKSKLISISKLVNVVKLFQDKVDEEIISINIGNSVVKTINDREYFVNLSTNEVSRSYPDI